MTRIARTGLASTAKCRPRARPGPKVPRAGGARAACAVADNRAVGGYGRITVSSDALIVFTPSGRRGRFPLGTSVLAAARQLGVDVDSVCGGRAMCGRCQVVLSEGSFAKHGISSTAEHLTAFSAVET